MEPMTLGSPVGSPTAAPSSPTSPFLPAYLMGDNAPSASTPRSSMQARQQTPKTVTFATSGLGMPSIHANAPASIGSGRALQSVTSPPEKPTSDFGPPVLGLFDTLSPLPGAGMSSHHNSTFPSTSGLFSPAVFTPNAPLFGSPLPSVPTPSQENPLSPRPDTSLFGSESQKLQETPRSKNSQGCEGRSGSPKEGEQNTWVTVFGFMPSAVNDIIAHFVHCGTILEHKWGSPAEGKNSVQRCNWIHLHFRTMREARRAIAKNGKVFGGCMMVGVVPCQDPEILRSQKENIQGPEISFPAKPKNASCAITGIRPLGLDFISPTKEPSKARSISSPGGESAGIRPLMKSNSLPQNEMELGGAKNGLISRTIDFLFGQ